jgi:hypothetical protein
LFRIGCYENEYAVRGLSLYFLQNQQDAFQRDASTFHCTQERPVEMVVSLLGLRIRVDGVILDTRLLAFLSHLWYNS